MIKSQLMAELLDKISVEKQTLGRINISVKTG
jgi:hypothetical protein